MANYDLEIEENIESTAWIEKDPFQSENIAPIYLRIDWENKTADVHTRYSNNGQPFREYYGIDEIFQLPENVDASSFKDFYDDELKPIIIKIGENFETYWDGNNTRGRFTNEDDYDAFVEPHRFEIMDIIEKRCPTHDKRIYFDIGESFQNYSEIIDFMDGSGIDFMTADLDNDEVIKEIVDYLSDDCYFVGDVDTWRNDLQNMRDYIEEKRKTRRSKHTN